MAQRSKLRTVVCLALVGLVASMAQATVPYTPLPGGFPGVGPGVAPPSIVPGKEYSHDLDMNTTPPVGLLDPEQVIAWDGIGGTADGIDFSFTRSSTGEEAQFDALANHKDFLFTALPEDDAHLIFSIDDKYTAYSLGTPFAATIPSAGPVVLSNGNTIGGAGELSIELGVYGGANAPDTQLLWAKQTDINASPLPVDVDGVELWGPEPAFAADTDKYSIDVDTSPPSTVVGGPPISVWNGSGSPYITHAAIVAAVTSLLPGGGSNIPEDQINLDALMVNDTVGEPDTFERDPTGAPEADTIIFSIRQIADPSDPDGYYATGSELFVLDATGAVTFLAHGDHLWDHAYSLTAFDVWFHDQDNRGVVDINAIEANTQQVVPEPTTMALLALGGLAVIRRRRA